MRVRSALSGLSAAILLALSTTPLEGKPSHAEAYSLLAQLPISFEANRGQSDARVDFLSRGAGYNLFLTRDEAVFVLKPIGQSTESTGGSGKSSVLRMRLVGGAAEPAVSGLEPLPGKSNYLIGRDPSKWRTGVPHYAKVKYSQVYAGIDLVYYGNQRKLEYDFIVAPGADPATIQLAFEGADGLSLDAAGDLLIDTPAGRLLQRAPLAYQEIDGVRQQVPARYELQGEDRVAFRVAAYDRGRTLVIDPALDYSTLIGSVAGELGGDIAVDATGAAYLAGTTLGNVFPTTPGVVAESSSSSVNAVVLKLDPSGSALVFSTFLGSTKLTTGVGVAVDEDGNVAVTGQASALSDLFVTPNAVVESVGLTDHAYVMLLNSTGSAIVYSTFIEGFGGSVAGDVAMDANGDIYATGRVDGSSMPTKNAFQTGNAGISDVYVMKLDPYAIPDSDPAVTGESLIYSTYLGGRANEAGEAIAVDGDGNAVITGATISTNVLNTLYPIKNAIQPSAGVSGIRTAFVSKIDPTQSGDASLLFSTFLGGSGGENGTAGDGGIAVDPEGDIYVTGTTSSTDFPTTPGVFQEFDQAFEDVFVTKLSADGSTLVFSTYLGGSFSDSGTDIAVDSAGNVYVTGDALSADFPTTPDAVQPFRTNSVDAFVTTLNSDGSALLYSTYLGGGSTEHATGIAVDSLGSAYATGNTGISSVLFPTTVGAYQELNNGSSDIYVTKFPGSSVPVIADAGPDQTLECTGVLTAVQLDGSASEPPTGLEYTWVGGFGTAMGVAPIIDLPVGQDTITLTVDDGAGGTATDVVVISILDTIAPAITLDPLVQLTATSADGAAHVVDPVVSDTCDPAADVVIEPDLAIFPPGETLVTVTATDDSGNTAQATQLVQVTFACTGFEGPVENPPVVNIGKAGRTYPLKWQCGDGEGGVIADLSIVQALTYTKVDCADPGTVIENPMESDDSGQSGLRVNPDTGRYSYNWKSPRTPGCYQFALEFIDGTSVLADFDLQ